LSRQIQPLTALDKAVRHSSIDGRIRPWEKPPFSLKPHISEMNMIHAIYAILFACGFELMSAKGRA
ncbi:MAG: hypothetical protein ACI9QL_005213, partial [Candidatus Omnitrophota bacterium]